MSKLVSANFSRLFRNKFFWICFALTIGVALFIAIAFRVSYPWCTKQFGHQTASTVFKYTPLLAGIAALFSCLFIGEEYSNKTIRNKVASGYSKAKIYGANWLVCAVAGVLFYVAFFLLVALPIAPWKELMKYNGYIIVRILKRTTVNLFAVVAVVSVAVFIAMLVKNRIVSVVVTVICMLVLFLASELMWETVVQKEYIPSVDAVTGMTTMEKNPQYESGVKRGVFQAIMDIQPLGQMKLARWEYDDGKRVLLVVYSCLISLISFLGGAGLFRKKDLE